MSSACVTQEPLKRRHAPPAPHLNPPLWTVKNQQLSTKATKFPAQLATRWRLSPIPTAPQGRSAPLNPEPYTCRRSRHARTRRAAT